jgi:hypothetical protein
MPSYAVESMRQAMTATGIVAPVFEWVDKPEGGRRQSDTQARNEATGMPLWEVEVLHIQSSFGRLSTATAKVVVDAPEEPHPAPLTPIGFTGLRVEVRINRAGGWSEYWSADSVLEPAKAGPVPSPSESGGSAHGSPGSPGSSGRSGSGERAA